MWQALASRGNEHETGHAEEGSGDEERPDLVHGRILRDAGGVSGSRIAAAVVIIGLVVLGAVAILVVDPFGSPEASPRPSPSATVGSPSHASTPAPSIPDALTGVTVGVGPTFAAGTRGAPTGDVAQSKLWFHGGAWWGALVAEGSDELRIHRFDWATTSWIDTGEPIGPWASVLPDVVSQGDQVWIATGGGATASRMASLVRFTYDADAGRYTRDSDVPVTIATERTDGLTLARDDGGRLWAAWVSGGQLVVNHTDGNDLVWGEPDLPAVAGVDAGVDVAAIAGYGDTAALVWTRTDVDAIDVAVASADGAAEPWQLSEVPVDGLAPGGAQLHLAVLPGADGPTLFIALRTSVATLAQHSSGAAQLLLIVVGPDGTVSQHLVGRVSDRHASPIVLLDGDRRVVYVVATSPSSGGAIFYKSASIDDISFAVGTGGEMLGVDALADLDAASSTKQLLGADTGIVVVASDRDGGSYAAAAAALPGGTAPIASLPPVVVPDSRTLVLDTFDPFPAGSRVGSQWDQRSGGAATFGVVDLDGRRVAAVGPAGDGSQVRMCRDIPPVNDGRLRIEALVMTGQAGPDDATITSLRHDGGSESAVVRFDDRGVFSYFAGTQNVRTTAPYVRGTWYDSVVTVDLATRTYAWEVHRASDGALVLSVSGVAWRAADAGAATDVCLESGGAASAGSVFAVDRIRVDH